MRNRATTPLSKAKVRQSWSKYNLYNLSRVRSPPFRGKTFFQQKWAAKSVLRSYHGEPVREAHWNKMFRRRLKAVVPMDPAYMAVNDGTIESAGRGSGLALEKGGSGGQPRSRSDQAAKETPYMQMTFAPLERRLDTAIFRSLFASSTRQARQFVVHGAVKVNGKKMIYPGYLLNPGDMFQVLPERVMFATGAPKVSLNSTTPTATDADEVDKSDASPEEDVAEPEPEPASLAEEDVDDDRTPREVLRDLQSQAKSILSHDRANLGAKRKQDLRAFTKAVRRMLSRSSSSTILTDSLQAQFAELKNQLRIQRQAKREGRTLTPAEQAKRTALGTDTSPDKPLADAQLDKESGDAPDPVTPDEQDADLDSEANYLSDADLNDLERALQSSIENPIDDSKPYATPWRPREYMSAFAFIPRYLEVNQNICAAVYLRHPVARPGIGEVPTPFGADVGGAAYTWYLRRR